MKKLKKKRDPEYSNEAEEIISKWKSKVNVDRNNKDTNLKESKNVSKASTSEIFRLSDLVSDTKKPKRSISEYKVMKKECENGKMPIQTLEAFGKNNAKGKKNADLSKSSIVPLPTVQLNDILSSNLLCNHSSNEFISKDKSLVKNVGSADGYSERRPIKIGPSEDEVLANIFSSKHSKKMLYTGRRHDTQCGFQPSKLFELSQRVLIDSLDDLPFRIATYSLIYLFILTLPYLLKNKITLK